jgi:hypothetical protein
MVFADVVNLKRAIRAPIEGADFKWFLLFQKAYILI